jgi:hypothetical protein
MKNEKHIIQPIEGLDKGIMEITPEGGILLENNGYTKTIVENQDGSKTYTYELKF